MHVLVLLWIIKACYSKGEKSLNQVPSYFPFFADVTEAMYVIG